MSSTKGLPRIPAYPLPRAEELPAPRAPWRLERDRAALLVHDMQRYFVGAFTPDEPPIEPVLANIHALAAKARRAGIPVFYTAQEGTRTGATAGCRPISGAGA